MYGLVLVACSFLPGQCADGVCRVPIRERIVERTRIVERVRDVEVQRPVLRGVFHRERFLLYRRVLRRHGE